jgi:hypothetical protein
VFAKGVSPKVNAKAALLAKYVVTSFSRFLFKVRLARSAAVKKPPIFFQPVRL